MKTLNPTWCGVLPMLIYAIATSTESTTGATAVEELQRAAEALDAWNIRAGELVNLLNEARNCIDDDEYKTAREHIRRALYLLEGES